jgi:hypothetical protein
MALSPVRRVARDRSLLTLQRLIRSQYRESALIRSLNRKLPQILNR